MLVLVQSRQVGIGCCYKKALSYLQYKFSIHPFIQSFSSTNLYSRGIFTYKFTEMAPLRSVFTSLVCVSSLFGHTASYAIGKPSLSGIQHFFAKPGRIALGSFDFSWGPSKRPAESIVPAGLEDWIQQQRKTSFRYMLDNIAPNGSNTKEAAPGVVIASPSKESPNYFYVWVRDAAITMGDVIEAYENNGDETLKSIIDSYTDLQGSLQNTFNPSGGYTTGGLGEPKFEIDGAPFTEFVSNVFTFVQFIHKTVTDRFARKKGIGGVHNGMVLLLEP
jgi:hypothetical protein